MACTWNGHRDATWTLALFTDVDQSSSHGVALNQNWLLTLTFPPVIAIFHIFGRFQKEKPYESFSLAGLNVLRMGLGQALRKNPRRWSLRFVLLAWLVLQMHVNVFYSDALLTRTIFERSQKQVPCFAYFVEDGGRVKFRRLFEAGLLSINFDERHSVEKMILNTNVLELLVYTASTGWALASLTFLGELAYVKWYATLGTA